jgi:hypothetical protein
MCRAPEAARDSQDIDRRVEQAKRRAPLGLTACALTPSPTVCCTLPLPDAAA